MPPELETYAPAVRRAVMDASAAGIAALLRRHFRAREAKGGKRPGWPRSHYWARAAESVSMTGRGDEARQVRATAPGLRMKMTGGVIRPKEKKLLAIPVRPEVAGKWPSEYEEQHDGVVFVRSRRMAGHWLLAKREENGHLRVLWVLVRKSLVKRDPTVLPSRKEFSSAALLAAGEAVAAFNVKGQKA